MNERLNYVQYIVARGKYLHFFYGFIIIFFGSGLRFSIWKFMFILFHVTNFNWWKLFAEEERYEQKESKTK